MPNYNGGTCVQLRQYNVPPKGFPYKQASLHYWQTEMLIIVRSRYRHHNQREAETKKLRTKTSDV